MTENLVLWIVGAAINGAVTWGVVSTKLDWMRRDIDDIDRRLEYLERRK